MKKELLIVARMVGILSGAGACLAWFYAMWVPVPDLPLSGISFFVAFLMAILAIFAGIASIHAHGVTLIVLFVTSFFPIGIYLLGKSSWVHIIGLLDFGFLFAGIIIWRIQTPTREANNSNT